MTGRIMLVATLVCAIAGSLAGASAQTPVDGRIVRVVYQVGTGGTWGFHLAQMKDGRYCVRFGNPGRLTLAIIERVANVCFDKMPATVERTAEQRSRAFNTQNQPITVVSYQTGSIAAAGSDIALEITTCNRVEGETKTQCFPNRYVVRMNGPECAADIALSRGKAGPTTCEHYAAQ